VVGDILETTDYPTVRAFAGGVSSDFVSDATLATFPFEGIVEAYIKERVTDWATIKAAAGTDWGKLQTATIALLSLRLVRLIVMGNPEIGASYNITEYSENPRDVDYEKLIEQLEAEVESNIDDIVDQNDDYDSFSGFLISGPTSAGANDPADIEEWIEKIEPEFITWLKEN
jgi:hypothetical protein